MKSDFFARRALLILCVVFFLIPFALRGARMSLERMENNVKDWLPDSFTETRELAWFARHFVGEQSFILLTWEGCSKQDESYRLFVEKLKREIQPDDEEQIPDTAVETTLASDEELPPHEQRARERELQERRARQWGDKLGLYTTGNDHFNWGGLDEKWLKGGDGSWYYITPNGDLYHWHGRSNVLGAMARMFQRHVLRDNSVAGTFVAKFGRPPSVENQNDFHDNPRKLTARVLKKVTTGPEVLEELSAQSGSMWPIGTQYSAEERPRIARRRALDRLKGSLFGPEPYEDFAWTADDLPRVLFDSKLEELPSDWQSRVNHFVQQLVRVRYEGDRHELESASLLDKQAHWNAMFAELEVDPPGLQTCIMVTLSPQGTADLRRVIGRGLLGKPRGKLINLAVESGIEAPSKPPMMPLVHHEPQTGKVLRMGGPPVDNVAIDEEGQITLVRLIGFSALLGIGLGYLCFRRVTVTMMIFVTGGVSAIASLGIVWWTGSCVDAILLSMPSLVYVLGLSGAVHIVNYYREAVQAHGVEHAPMRALRHGAIPCTLAAFTTALGLLSLYTSDIAPIRRFGLYSALGVMATLILLFTYLPSALQLWPPRYGQDQQEASKSSFRHKIHHGWLAIGDWVVRHHVAVAGVSIAVLIGVGYGMTKLNTSIQLLKLFDQDSKIIRDYYWLESNVGKLVPMELVVAVDKQHQYPTIAQRESTPSATAAELDEEYQFNFLERVEMVAHIQQAVEDVFGERGQDIVGRALSAATFAPPILDPLDTQRFPTNTLLEKNRDRLLAENYLAVDDAGNELWRISLRLGALNDVDYGQFVSQLKRVVEPVLGAYDLRDRVLRAVAKRREEQGLVPAEAADPWQGAKIAILGSGNPRNFEQASASTDADRAAATTAENASAEASKLLAKQSDQDLGVDRVFAQVLGDLLRAKKFHTRRGGRAPKHLLEWHDPLARPLAENATSQAWANMLGQFDCVVVVRDHPDYHMDFLREHCPLLIDARDHGFAAGTDKTAKQLGKPIQVTYTGVVPIVYKAQRTLLHSLIDSIGWAFVMIAIVMMILLRRRKRQLLNVRGGLVAMIPNVFPVILVFGLIGHLSRWGILVDIGTMMTASVAMGVAVDDTIHFLTWFRRGVREGLDRHAAIKHAYAHVAVAMTQTTIIGGLGLSVFALSTFTPTQRFGTMMLTLLAAALIGDLILLPALLAGPLGKYLCPDTANSEGDPPVSGEGVESAAPERPAVLPIGRGVSVKGPAMSRGEQHPPSLTRRDGTHGAS